MDEILDKLKNPPKEYRAVPFWSWNDKLDPEFLRWQIREMDRAGLGGYFMHARGGLQTEYLSEEWMSCIQACIEEGNKLGMNSWCYDEEGWPSGFAGGIVTSKGDLYHVRWLEIEECKSESLLSEEQILGVYVLNFEKKLTLIPKDEIKLSMDRGKKVYIVRHKSNPYYIDILNKEVIKAFIECTYEEYYKRFKDEFGKGMPGFFTDEPQFSREHIPWSYILPEAFEKKHGYDVIEQLAALFIECEGYEKFRYDFWSTVNELYVTSFGEQIFKWCDEHHCQWTGHVMMEDSLFAQMMATAGGMPFYEYMHIPGMDWLCRYISSPVIPKQVSSVANQLGKKFVLSETFALCGWDVSFEELKWIAEWQYVNGVNLMCQHLEGYTLRGLRKRDYPPSLFYQQSWWDEYHQFNDYFARLGVLLTSGKNAAGILLLHPMKSGWIAYDHSNNATMQRLDQDFVKATELLAGFHLEHHYGDETIIQKYGRVAGGRFIIGQCEYKTVIMPSMLTIDENTLELLNQFMNQGGTVISIGRFPQYINGVPSEKLNLLKGRVICLGDDITALYTVMQEKELSVISITENGDEIGLIHYQQRDLGDRQLFFMANRDQNTVYNTEVKLKGKGRVTKILAETAEVLEISYQYEGDFTKVNLEFLPMQSHILVIEKEVTTSPESTQTGIVEVKPGNDWLIDEMDLNSMTLDFCSYSIDQGDWQGPIPVIKLMDILLNLKRSCNIALKFNFEVDMDLQQNKEFYLAVETADEFEIIINGNSVQYKDLGWWKDSSFKKVDIKPFVRTGSNEIILKRNFYQAQKVYDVLFGENVLETEINKLTYDVELESIYLVGDFGVISRAAFTSGERKALYTEGPFVIVGKPQNIRGGELTQQGFCFFAGSVKLSQQLQINKKENEKLILDIKKPNAIITKVFVNDQPVKTLLWAPYKVDITDFINDDTNKVTIQLFAGNRNLLGPHHHIAGELYAVAPSSFTDKPGWAEGGRYNEIWRNNYCFVKFGLED